MVIAYIDRSTCCMGDGSLRGAHARAPTHSGTITNIRSSIGGSCAR